ncbi:hypothetical protein ACTGUP_08955 [Streptococcus suis]
MLINENLILIQDGEMVPSEFINEKKLSRLTTRIGNNNYISFVGIVLNHSDVIISVPKHFYLKNDLENNISSLTKNQILSDTQFLIEIIVKGESSYKGSEEKNFPIDSYLKIQNYYKKFGLYSKQNKTEYTGDFGKINWKKTIQKSSKIIQKNGIVFYPFQLEKKIHVNNFISECMEYVLGFTYEHFSPFLNFITPYRYQHRNPIFNNYKYCKNELQRIKAKYFKDIEKSLIDSLINFFAWLSKREEQLTIATQNFELYWEALVDIWLNKNFNSVSSSGKINSGVNFGGSFSFKNELLKVEDKHLLKIQNRVGFSLQFDHYRLDEKQVLLFDSKYTKEDQMPGFNYKQAFYYYFLNTMFPDKTIINGLILPTASVYTHSIHIDRETKVIYDTSGFNFWVVDTRFIDGLKIIEHKINLRDAIELGAKFSDKLRMNLLKNRQLK